MNELLEEIFKNKEFRSKTGKITKLHSHTSQGQCNYLAQLIKENNYNKSIEIGFAYGISSLAIVDSIIKNGNHKHVIIDKFEISSWEGLGLELIDYAGFTQNIEFYEDYCYNVLPKLLNENNRFDFAYIDSTKQFDWLLNNFFYIDKMLDIGGIIVFDDVAYPGIRKLARFICSFPSYQVHSSFPGNYKNSKLKFFSRFIKLIPGLKKLFRHEWIETDNSKGINSNCVAFKKISDDKRNWDWYAEF